MLLLLSADFFSKLTFSENSFRNSIRVSNGLDPDQYRHSGSKLFAKASSRRQVTDSKGKSFSKILSGTLLEYPMVWIQIRTDILSVLIWVQTICKGLQQTTKVAASKEKSLRTWQGR